MKGGGKPSGRELFKGLYARLSIKARTAAPPPRGARWTSIRPHHGDGQWQVSSFHINKQKLERKRLHGYVEDARDQYFRQFSRILTICIISQSL
jgi:hypothetical protein